MVPPRMRLPKKHCTASSYRQGCSCDECRKAWAKYTADYRTRNPRAKKAKGGQQDGE